MRCTVSTTQERDCGWRSPTITAAGEAGAGVELEAGEEEEEELHLPGEAETTGRERERGPRPMLERDTTAVVLLRLLLTERETERETTTAGKCLPGVLLHRGPSGRGLRTRDMRGEVQDWPRLHTVTTETGEDTGTGESPLPEPGRPEDSL